MKTALLLASLLLTACATPSTGIQERPVLITIEPYIAKLRTVDVEIAGNSYDFLFDTGGSYTLIAPEIAEVADCTPHGKLSGFRMNGERVDSAKCGMVNFSIAGKDFRTDSGHFDINSLLPEKFPTLYGVISLDTFKDEVITLDLATNRLVIETEKSLELRVADMRRIKANFYNEIEGRGMAVYLEVDSPHGHVNLLLDSGNLAGNLLRSESWQEIAGSATAPEPGTTGELTLRFGDAGAVKLPVKAADIIREGGLDVNFVESAVFTFDFPNRLAWIRFHERKTE